MGRTRHTLVAAAFTLVSCTTQIMPAATPITQVTALRVYATTATTTLLHTLTTTYRQSHPEIAFEIAVGSYQAIAERVLHEEGAYFFSHHLPEEIDRPESRFWAAPIAQDALSIIVHPSNPTPGLSLNQLRSIYAGQRPHWSEFGGFNQDIAVITRQQGASLHAEFDALVMGTRPTTARAQVVPSEQAMADAVARLPGAIGYASLSSLSESLRALPIDGVLPSARSVYEAAYPLRTTLYIIGRQEPLDFDYPEMRAFIGWIQSPVGQQIVAQQYAPLLLLP